MKKTVKNNRIVYIKKLKFHNLFSGKITYKLHVDLLRASFRIPYWKENQIKSKHNNHFELFNL